MVLTQTIWDWSIKVTVLISSKLYVPKRHSHLTLRHVPLESTLTILCVALKSTIVPPSPLVSYLPLPTLKEKADGVKNCAKV